MTQPEAQKFFIEYNNEHPKSITDSIHELSRKLVMSYKETTEFIGEDYIKQAKNLPSEGQLEVLNLFKEGKFWSEIARELGVSRQAVNITRRQLVKKGLIVKVDEDKYELVEAKK